MRYLLDSALLIDHGNRDVAATALLRRLVEDGHDLYACDVVTCEVLSRGDEADLRHMQALLDALEYVATTPAAARSAGAARRARNAAGGKRALGDALISAIAADLGAIVVTRNRRDFEHAGIQILGY
ncbi:MAG: PIN domain-containing protein [Chloroflexota bacterium]|nr:MAG: PIN domain-containing protein [Chloroflexota bacterium]